MSRKRKIEALGGHIASAAVGDMMSRTISAAVGKLEEQAAGVEAELADRLDRLVTMARSAVEAAEGVHIRNWWLRRWLWQLRGAACEGAAAVRASKRRAAADAGARAPWWARLLWSAKILLVPDGGAATLRREVEWLEEVAAGIGNFLKLLEMETRAPLPPSPPPAPAYSLVPVRSLPEAAARSQEQTNSTAANEFFSSWENEDVATGTPFTGIFPDCLMEIKEYEKEATVDGQLEPAYGIRPLRGLPETVVRPQEQTNATVANEFFSSWYDEDVATGTPFTGISPACLMEIKEYEKEASVDGQLEPAYGIKPLRGLPETVVRPQEQTNATVANEFFSSWYDEDIATGTLFTGISPYCLTEIKEYEKEASVDGQLEPGYGIKPLRGLPETAVRPQEQTNVTVANEFFSSCDDEDVATGTPFTRIFPHWLMGIKEYETEASVDGQLERLGTLVIMLHSAVDQAERVHILNWWVRRWLRRLRDAALDGDEVLRSFSQRRAAEEAAAGGRAGGTLWSAARRVLLSTKTVLFAGGKDTERLSGAVARLDRVSAGLGDFLKLLDLEIRRSSAPARTPSVEFEPSLLNCLRGTMVPHEDDDDDLEPILHGVVEQAPRSCAMLGGDDEGGSGSSGEDSEPGTRLDGLQLERGLSYISREEYIAGTRKIALLVVRQRICRAMGKLRKPAAPPAPRGFPAADTDRLQSLVTAISRAVRASDREEVYRQRWLAKWRRELQAVADKADSVLLAAQAAKPGGHGSAVAISRDVGDEVRRTADSVETAAAHLGDFVTLVKFAVVAN